MSFSDVVEILGKILLVPPFYSDGESELSIAASLFAALVGMVAGRGIIRPHRSAWLMLVLIAAAFVAFLLYWFYLYNKGDMFLAQTLCRIVFFASLGALIFSVGDADNGGGAGP